ncbi:glycosyltransferase family 2 protein [Microcystis aeruginosa CS-564/01]|uniref:glycosyltransferase family 2 protein n=1 Tax=Microcystis aeruginosa TaxID=1126 RepID=UPI00232E5EC6|nr:glycosyltransferase family 2 protein [Microcystis aeruginosa]MDB9425747.1 glycosyltransferase family 2 protein [Microcystis aeruginosa CS-564/01]
MKIINLNHNFSTTRKLTSDPLQYPILSPPNLERKGEGGLRSQGYFKQSYDEASGLSDNSPLPLVTIITVVFNGEKHLEQTIQSVINQTYDNVEYIVIDGGSTDGTVDIIRKYENQIDYWVSEPDGGLYHAINKGITLCMGRLVGIIHAGDNYTLEAIVEVVEAYLKKTSAALFIGDCQCLFRDNYNWYIRSGNLGPLPYKTLPHPSTFVSLEIYKKYGAFETSFKIASDYEFFCRCFAQSVEFIYINKTIAIMMNPGISNNYYMTAKEELMVRMRYLPKLLAIIIFLRSCLTITGHKALEYLGLWYLIEAKRHGSIG